MPGSKSDAERKPRVEQSDMEGRAPVSAKMFQVNEVLLDDMEDYKWFEVCISRDELVRTVVERMGDSHVIFTVQARKRTGGTSTIVSKLCDSTIPTKEEIWTSKSMPVKSQNARVKKKCSQCGKIGHDKITCFRLMTCDHCKITGHPTKSCRVLTGKMIELDRRARAGKLTTEEVLELLA